MVRYLDFNDSYNRFAQYWLESWRLWHSYEEAAWTGASGTKPPMPPSRRHSGRAK